MTPDEARARALYAEACAAIPEFEGFMRELYAIGRVPPDFVGPIHSDARAAMDPPMIDGLRNMAPPDDPNEKVVRIKYLRGRAVLVEGQSQHQNGADGGSRAQIGGP